MFLSIQPHLCGSFSPTHFPNEMVISSLEIVYVVIAANSMYRTLYALERPSASASAWNGFRILKHFRGSNPRDHRTLRFICVRQLYE